MNTTPDIRPGDLVCVSHYWNSDPVRVVKVRLPLAKVRLQSGRAEWVPIAYLEPPF